MLKIIDFLVKKWQYFFVAILILSYAIFLFNESLKKKSVLENPEYTEGWIVKYGITGEMNSTYLTYGYRVKNRVYERYITPLVRFDHCEHKIELCEHYRFWVIYEKGNPSSSMINLYQQIQFPKGRVKPKTFKGFQ